MEVTNNAAMNTQNVSAPKTAAEKAAVDYNTFLQLLVAQMKNQDPTNPTDSAEYMGQLAQFSSVEQAIQTNAKLDALLSSQALSQADGIIGRTITSADGKVSGKVASVTIIQGGALATLENGDTLVLAPGVRIS